MEIVAFVLFVNAVIILGLTAAVTYVLRLWPLHERLGKAEPIHAGNAGVRGSRSASAL